MNFLSFFSFLSIHRAQQPRSGWPSNVFRRFGRRQSFKNWSRDLAHVIFTGVKKCENWRRFQHHLTLRLCFRVSRPAVCPYVNIYCAWSVKQLTKTLVCIYVVSSSASSQCWSSDEWCPAAEWRHWILPVLQQTRPTRCQGSGNNPYCA